jgi:hypothetical protein
MLLVSAAAVPPLSQSADPMTIVSASQMTGLTIHRGRRLSSLPNIAAVMASGLRGLIMDSSFYKTRLWSRGA